MYVPWLVCQLVSECGLGSQWHQPRPGAVCYRCFRAGLALRPNNCFAFNEHSTRRPMEPFRSLLPGNKRSGRAISFLRPGNKGQAGRFVPPPGNKFRRGILFFLFRFYIRFYCVYIISDNSIRQLKSFLMDSSKLSILFLFLCWTEETFYRNK